MSTPHVISVSSVEYVKVPVRAKSAGTYPDITEDDVSMAFVADGTTPGDDDWNDATWETDATTNPATYSAICIPVLEAGTYRIWVKVTDSPETPWLESGLLVVKA